jgi:hypothetical protein
MTIFVLIKLQGKGQMRRVKFSKSLMLREKEARHGQVHTSGVHLGKSQGLTKMNLR